MPDQSSDQAIHLRCTPRCRQLSVANSMLDLEFAQLSDPGQVRDHNEDYLGHVAADRDAKPARTAGCSRWPTASAATNGRGRIASRRRDSSTGFAAAPAASRIAGLLHPPGADGQRHVYEAGAPPVPAASGWRPPSSPARSATTAPWSRTSAIRAAI